MELEGKHFPFLTKDDRGRGEREGVWEVDGALVSLTVVFSALSSLSLLVHSAERQLLCGSRTGSKDDNIFPLLLGL